MHTNLRNDSNEKVIYDLDTHKYYITPFCIEDEYGINLYDPETLNPDGDVNPDTLPERFLKRVSDSIYDYIYSWSQNKKATEYVLSSDTKADDFKDVLLEATYAFLINNTDKNAFYRDNFRDLIVTPSVHAKLMNNGMLFRGEYILDVNFNRNRGVDY